MEVEGNGRDTELIMDLEHKEFRRMKWDTRMYYFENKIDIN